MYVYVAIALLIAALSGAGAWRINEWRHASNEKERIELEAEKRKLTLRAIDKAAEGHESDKVEIRTKYITVTKEVDRIVKEPFYVDGGMCLDADGLRVIAQAIGPATAASIPASAVRPTDKPR